MTLGLGSLDTDEAPPLLEGVGLPRRALARLIDIAALNLVLAMGGGVFILAAALAGGPSTQAAIELFTSQATTSVSGRLWDALLGLLCLTLMHTLCEGLHGSTLGKRLCGITVVSQAGGPAGLSAGFKRSVGFLIDQFLCGLVGAHKILNSPQAQRIGDEWADTLVVRLRALDPASRRSGLRFLAAASTGVLACGSVAILATGLQIGRWAWLAAEDRLHIVAVRPKAKAPLQAGRSAVFVVSVTHTLKSAPAGRLRLSVVRGDDVVLQGTHHIEGGTGTTRIEGTATLPVSQPGYSDPPLPRFIVELYPASNEESPSAEHVVGLERVPCRPPLKTPELICVG